MIGVRSPRVFLPAVPCPSATFAVWTSAWLHGAAAADDVLDAMQNWSESHSFTAADVPGTELPRRGESPAGTAAVLAELRRLDVASVAMVLPVPGDVRGTGGKGPFSDAAVAAGEGVLLGDSGLGLVPRRDEAPSHPEVDDLPWTLLPLPDVPSIEHVPLAEAEHELAGAMRAAATALVELDVARHRPNVRAEIDEIVQSAPALSWPDGMPSRAVRVLQRATEVDAILRVASGDAPGGALSASATNARAGALAPLSHAIRFARYAAINETVRLFAETAGKS